MAVLLSNDSDILQLEVVGMSRVISEEADKGIQRRLPASAILVLFDFHKLILDELVLTVEGLEDLLHRHVGVLVVSLRAGVLLKQLFNLFGADTSLIRLINFLENGFD